MPYAVIASKSLYGTKTSIIPLVSEVKAKLDKTYSYPLAIFQTEDSAIHYVNMLTSDKEYSENYAIKYKIIKVCVSLDATGYFEKEKE